ncbi:MAG: hypothetical protein C4523_00705 [Myxococcales bacterium]|nr:MAG: hypothetical protein C4523_00705 [Myxococcales bacterium]
MEKHGKLYAGILLISTATLALEVLQVRLFSVMLWHHLAYMVITVTLLGFSAAGAYVAVKGTGTDDEARRKAGWSSLLFALTTILAFAVVSRVPLDTYMQSSVLQLSFIFLYYAFLIVPYFFAGLAITLLLSHYVRIVHRLYFWNLLGSAIGCLLFLLLLMQLGGEGALFATAALGAAAALPLFAERRLRIVSGAAAVVLLLLIPAATSIVAVQPAPSKALGMFLANTPDVKLESTKWDPVARIDVVSSPAFANMYRYHEAAVRKIFTIDGDAFTFVYSFDRPFPEIELIGKTLYGSAYFLKDKPKVAIIGLGGGTDIITALHFQAREITGVEINQAMIDAAMDTFDTYPINPYRDPSVTILHEEGRSFLRRTEEKYDIIQMSGVDTWSAMATGAYVLSENYLYTKEAFGEYYDHLAPDGLLCMIRWIFDPPREMLRLATVQSAVLKGRGVKSPWHHMVVIKQGLLASVVTKMTPFTRREIAGLKRSLSNKPELELLYAPGEEGQTMFHRYFEAMKKGKEAEFIAQYPYKIDVVDDDRPFFFEYYKWSDMFGTQFGKGGYLAAARPIGYIILLASLIQAVIFGLAFILLPLYKFKGAGLATDGAGKMIIYFAALGMGFMFIEVALMQRFVLFLGHPTFSIAITMFALLVFTGVGSAIAGRVNMEPRRIVLIATIGIAITILAYMLGLTPLFNAMLGLPLWARAVAAVILLAPLGMMMGMPFPTGLAYVRRGAAAFVPWAFGINGVASVAASVLCIILAILAGFTLVFVCAALIYLIGGFALYRLTLKDRQGGV